ncbi:Nucleoporin-like protein amo1 [Frankliniella fusca]|uniref:Nucleoporin NUP42 n=1 Tax=Frankliniella fusca TaxID=407009 RepID=A0AAE1L916_9NEOP|nr:Nucleoporin-like protein amo1 [Frankliniella fusca]
MTLCRFFQQGYCRYGNSCRFEHAAPQYASTVSPLLRNNIQPPPNVTAPKSTQGINTFRTNRKDARDIFNFIVQDVNEAEKGGIWPLSSYNFWPAVAHGNVPGLEDLSPEEMRYLQMQAQAAGTFDACNQQIQQMYQQARARFNSLKVQSPETVALIESMTRGPAPTASTQFSFASGSAVAQDSWPSPTATGGSVFGGSPGSTKSNSIFGGATTTGSTSTGFGSVFGGTNNPVQSSIFGGASQYGTAAAPKPSIFGGATTQTHPPAFAPTNPMFPGGAPSPFGAPQQPSVFGGATATQQASPFGTSPAVQQSSPFGGTPTVGQSGGSIFGGSASATTAKANTFSFALSNAFGAGANTTNTSTFGGAATASPSVFGGAPQSNTQSTSSIFGGMASMQNPSAQSANISVNTTLYTAISQLTDEERAQFEADTFTAGKIPCRPPPKELC